jgi:catechol 2,3-dioxygenase-like lactoylglutathione lyase family enzyme
MAFAHFTAPTRDVAAASRFFQAVFGWRPLKHHTNIPPELRPAWLERAPGQEMHLLEVADFAPSPFEREYGRHIALPHPLHDLAALQARLVQHGAELIAPQRLTSAKRFFFKDPNGYVFEVIGTWAAALAGSWATASGVRKRRPVISALASCLTRGQAAPPPAKGKLTPQRERR